MLSHSCSPPQFSTPSVILRPRLAWPARRGNFGVWALAALRSHADAYSGTEGEHVHARSARQPVRSSISGTPHARGGFTYTSASLRVPLGCAELKLVYPLAALRVHLEGKLTSIWYI